MELKIASYKIAHITAFVAAFAVHIGIVIGSMLPSDPIVLSNQTIRVNFVAPSSAQDSHGENLFYEKDFIEKKNQSSADKKFVSSGKKQSVAGRETVGHVDPNATSARSVESEPVFDAQYLNNPVPLYPQLARQRGVQGMVLVNVVVKTDGTPADVIVTRSSGYEILDVAALDAVKQWRFIPAKRSGKVVEANVVVPVEFKII